MPFKQKKLLVVLFITTVTFSLQASANCYQQAANRYSVDESILKAIVKVESNFNQYAIHYNTDGSHDIGLTQINSSHLPELAKYGITEKKLLDNACLNLNIGAWILSQYMHQYGQTWRSVGTYNTGKKKSLENARIAYVRKVKRAYVKLNPQTLNLASSS